MNDVPNENASESDTAEALLEEFFSALPPIPNIPTEYLKELEANTRLTLVEAIQAKANAETPITLLSLIAEVLAVRNHGARPVFDEGFYRGVAYASHPDDPKPPQSSCDVAWEQYLVSNEERLNE
jgi:hypothetical protein